MSDNVRWFGLIIEGPDKSRFISRIREYLKKYQGNDFLYEVGSYEDFCACGDTNEGTKKLLGDNIFIKLTDVSGNNSQLSDEEKKEIPREISRAVHLAGYNENNEPDLHDAYNYGAWRRLCALSDEMIKSFGLEKVEEQKKAEVKCKEGDTIRVLSGLFEGTVSKVEQIDYEMEFIGITIDFLGRKSPAEIDFTTEYEII